LSQANVVAHSALDGILNVDKPPGMTSHDVVAAIRSEAKAYLEGGRRIASLSQPAAAGGQPSSTVEEATLERGDPREEARFDVGIARPSKIPAKGQPGSAAEEARLPSDEGPREPGGPGEEPGAPRKIKVGHAGTLDPLATGVLLVCLGRATRVSEYLMRSPKVYGGTIHLGITTTTHDAEGEVTSRSPVDVTRDEIEAVLARFVGIIDQLPPRYSAIKHHGKPLYAWTREGVEIEVAPRQVEIEAIEIVAWDPPELTVKVRCGPGTYIRALARDVGRALGCGGYLSALRRTASGAFRVSDAVDLETLRAAFATGQVHALLHGIEAAFYDLPVLCLDADQAHRLAVGQFIEDVAGPDHDDLVRARGPDGQFIALAFRDKGSGAWRPRKVFVRPEEMTS
jgi:tRNA pseudouridine55 synthase